MYKDKTTGGHCIYPVSRRRFVQGLAAGGAIVTLDWSGYAFGENTPPHTPPTLAGKHFDLTIDSLPVNYTGCRSIATEVNGSMPGPILRWKEGDTVTLAVTNRLKVPASIHWHAIRLPADMDGVPGLSFPGIAPDETFHYSGFSDLDTGVRLRDESSRKFAPYIGFAYTGKYGNTASYSRQAGEATSEPRFIFGLRLWY